MSYLVLKGQGLKSKITKATKRLKPISNEFNLIAFRGISGGLVAPAVAANLDKYVLAVRSHRSCHSDSWVEGPKYGYRTKEDKKFNYIIIDDFIESGRTISNIVKKVHEFDDRYTCVGVYFYSWNPWRKQFVVNKIPNLRFLNERIKRLDL